MHHRQTHTAFIVEKLAAKRIAEALDRMLCGAVRGLQRNAAVRERRSDLHDRPAIARFHAPECGQRSPDVAEVGDVRDAAIFVGFHLHDRREHRQHRVVDPDVDRAESLLDLAGRFIDGVVIRDIEGKDERLPARGFDFAPGRFESIAAAGDQPDFCFAFAECLRRSAADAGRRACNDNDFLLHAMIRSKT